MSDKLSSKARFLLASSLLFAVMMGAGCKSGYDQQGTDATDAPPPMDRAQSFPPDVQLSTVLPGERQRVAEDRLRIFIDALDRGDAAAARAMYSTRQIEPDLLLALTPAELHNFAASLRTYQFGGVWGDRVEFRPTRYPPDQAVTSLYVHFASGTEGITY